MIVASQIPALAWFVVLAAGEAAPPPPALTPETARPAFQLATEVCERDAGLLWGESLCGPILLVDPSTREVVASHGDAEGRLTARGEVFVGTLPSEVSPANTAIDWAGVRWSMLLWPLPEDPVAQGQLLLHELFHRIQPQLRLPAGNPANQHLDTEMGRAWLQLEWRALTRAHETPANGGRREILLDALAFRVHRWSLFPEAKVEEVALEKNEGLAEYTGLVLSGAEPARRRALANLRSASKKPSFVRSFAYASGPAYGLFLDTLRPHWRREMPNRVIDLGRLLALALGLTSRDLRALGTTALERAERYGGAELFIAERERAARRAAQRAELRARLVDGPVLRLPFERMTIAFDPGELVSLEGEGTVYPGTRITDDWGVLTVTMGGALVDGAWSRVQVGASRRLRARDGVVRGDGWTLELAPGWRLAKVAKTRERPVRGWTVEKIE